MNPADPGGLTAEHIEAWLNERAKQAYQGKEELVGSSMMREAERNIMLHVIDDQWKDHLFSMDHLKEGIGLRGYGQKDPLVEYPGESFKLFEAMMDRIEDKLRSLPVFPALRNQRAFDAVREIDEEGMEDDDAREAEAERKRIEQSKAAEEEQRRNAQSAVQDMTRNIQRQHDEGVEGPAVHGHGEWRRNGKAPVVHAPKTGRNDPCPCGSDKKHRMPRNAT